MAEDYFKKITAFIILGVLAVLSFLLLKPILMAMIFGGILAYIFLPIYKGLFKLTNSKNFSASAICVLLILIAVAALWFLTPILMNQAVKLYLNVQQFDVLALIESIFPPSYSETFATEIAGIISSFLVNLTDYLVSGVSSLIFNLPTIMLQLLVVFFTLFFVLRDKDEIKNAVKSLLPFSEKVNKKLFEYSKGITSSVLYGQVIVGLAQGAIIALGFFLFGVSNALLFSILAIFAGILPIIGTMLIWFPVMIYVFLQGNTLGGLGILVFGLISSNIDNFLRPLIVSRKVKMPSSIILIGMIGGIFLFGVLGLILGPLILAYFLIVLEAYQKKTRTKVLIQEK